MALLDGAIEEALKGPQAKKHLVRILTIIRDTPDLRKYLKAILAMPEESPPAPAKP